MCPPQGQYSESDISISKFFYLRDIQEEKKKNGSEEEAISLQKK